MGKLEGKVAVITGGSSGMALASAKRFVEEGAYVFITGRRQETLDAAVKQIGRNVTAVRGDAANLDDLDRLFDTVARERGKIDILYASAGTGDVLAGIIAASMVHWLMFADTMFISAIAALPRRRAQYMALIFSGNSDRNGATHWMNRYSETPKYTANCSMLSRNGCAEK